MLTECILEYKTIFEGVYKKYYNIVCWIFVCFSCFSRGVKLLPWILKLIVDMVKDSTPLVNTFLCRNLNKKLRGE